MSRQKVGLVLFKTAVVWAFLWGTIGSVSVDMGFRNLSMDALNQTMWAFMGPWHLFWALQVPLSAAAAGIGLLLYAGAPASKGWKYGIGIVLGVSLAWAVRSFGHIPPLFGIGGTAILLLFFGTLWLWTKERMALAGSSATSADLRLLGYVFMLVAAWFICGLGSRPFLRALEEETPGSPIHVMILLVLGWLFLFLSHYKSRNQQGS